MRQRGEKTRSDQGRVSAYLRNEDGSAWGGCLTSDRKTGPRVMHSAEHLVRFRPL